MERNFIKVLCLGLSLALVGCSANHANDGKTKVSSTQKVDSSNSLYSQKGMEISKVVSDMSDLLYKTMVNDLSSDPNRTSVDKDGKTIVDTTPPKVAITSFVDTDTYKDSGYIGRALAEMFVHEFDRRGIKVFEYKLTGAISITKDGEFVFSRDWKKVARQAMVRHIFAGTVTRNDKGIVLVGRIINMADQTVVGSSTGFIPYEKLPYCYRTSTKDCSLNGVTSYNYEYTPGSVVANGKVYDTVTKRTVSASSSTATPSYTYKVDKDEQRRQKEKEFVDNYYRTDTDEFNSKYYVKGAKVPATSTGNYEEYMYRKEHGILGIGSGGLSPVIYPADTYEYGGKLVRDVHDESQYTRTKY